MCEAPTVCQALARVHIPCWVLPKHPVSCLSSLPEVAHLVGDKSRGQPRPVHMIQAGVLNTQEPILFPQNWWHLLRRVLHGACLLGEVDETAIGGEAVRQRLLEINEISVVFLGGTRGSSAHDITGSETPGLFSPHCGSPVPVAVTTVTTTTWRW